MFAVAIDGPSGVGKSSVSKAVAERLGFLYVDTGALYRTVALYLLEHNIPVDNEQLVAASLPNMRVEMQHTDSGQRMLLCGKDVTEQIRSEEVSKAASISSALPAVREFLLNLQQGIAQKHNVVMDGRDIATVVLPEAQIKIFLTASPEERAKRRFKQLSDDGYIVEYQNILNQIIERDNRDQDREISPLRPAEEAIFLDSSNNQKKDTIEQIVEMIERKLHDKDTD